MMKSRLRPSGGYRALHSFQVTTVIYDGTVSFCRRFVEKHSRLVDQMTQAARSGRQNIAEGSRASATSSQTELRLPQWTKDSPEALAVRCVGQRLAKEDRTDPSDLIDQFPLYRPWLEHRDPAVVANALICLIHQANYLLDQQVRSLEQQFVTKGGYSEQLATARLQERSQKQNADPAPPACPVCGGLMALRTAKNGPRAGSQFWGCTKYPTCKGTKPL
jgi:four helix bundle suffix protein